MAKEKCHDNAKELKYRVRVYFPISDKLNLLETFFRSYCPPCTRHLNRRQPSRPFHFNCIGWRLSALFVMSERMRLWLRSTAYSMKTCYGTRSKQKVCGRRLRNCNLALPDIAPEAVVFFSVQSTWWCFLLTEPIRPWSSSVRFFSLLSPTFWCAKSQIHSILILPINNDDIN